MYRELALPPAHEHRLRQLMQFCGQPLVNAMRFFNMFNLIDEAQKYTLQKRKGSIGVVCEPLLTGVRGDNRAVADWDKFEIKAVSVAISSPKSNLYSIPGTNLKFVENMRLTKINYTTIQTESFTDSSLANKSVMIVMLIEKCNLPIHERKLLDIGIIDLRPHFSVLEQDFNNVKQVCHTGCAHELSSKSIQPNKLAKTYSSGNGANLHEYIDSDGVIQQAKGKAFYLFKDALATHYFSLHTAA